MNLNESVYNQNINSVIKDFLFHCQFEKSLSSKTVLAYKTDLTQFANYLEGSEEDKTLAKASKEVLKAYLQEISHFKPKTIKRKVASLKSMLNYIEYENDNYINPFRKIKIRLKEPLLLPSVMTLSEVKKILNMMYLDREKNIHTLGCEYKSQTRNLAVVEILFSTGMRVSEVCNLKIQDINLRTGIIKVFGKGSKERIIQICQAETLSVIKAYYKLHKDRIDSNNFFFVNRLGLQLSTQSVRHMIKACVNKTGLRTKITPHTFRHTFATLLLEEDVDIKYIQNMLGHSSIATTQIYTHVNMTKQRKILSTKHPRRKLQMVIND